MHKLGCQLRSSLHPFRGALLIRIAPEVRDSWARDPAMTWGIFLERMQVSWLRQVGRGEVSGYKQRRCAARNLGFASACLTSVIA